MVCLFGGSRNSLNRGAIMAAEIIPGYIKRIINIKKRRKQNA